MVIGSYSVSLGLLSFFEQKITLFISVILPFLVLAIGLDNIFVLVDTLENTDPALPYQERVAEALSQAGSSMALASLSESLSFFLGLWAEMPAVRSFALYAGVAIFCNFLLQTTCFIAFVTLDLKRIEVRGYNDLLLICLQHNRVDCFPCIKLHEWKAYSSDDLAPLLRGVARKRNRGALRVFAERYYGPFLLHPVVKCVVV